MADNITSANATAVMVVDTLFPVGFTLEHFSTDQSIQQEARPQAETRMGVDGHMAAGWVPGIKTVTVMLEPSSPSIDAMDQWILAQDESHMLYSCSLAFSVPAVGKTFQYSGGVLQQASDIPNGAKTLQPRTFTFHFETLKASPL